MLESKGYDPERKGMLAQRLETLNRDPRAPCLLIAEIGVNHGGDLELAKRMVLAAKQAGADAVKFQTFTADALVTRSTPKAPYQERTTPEGESHFDMIRKLELSRADHAPLLEFCRSARIGFLSTPYDVDSARFLDGLGVEAYKIASADIVDLPLQEFVASTGKWSIVATGMATLGEIDEALEPYRRRGNRNLALLHCVSNYPCSTESLNLRAMPLLAATFGTLVGFSDHSQGDLAAALSVALGARIVEKHFTLDKSLPGPDHQASSTPGEFSALVATVRRAESALGEARKVCQEEERRMAQVSRKSLVLAKPLRRSEILTQDHLACKRPGTGLRPAESRRVVGLKARRDLPADALLAFEDLE